MKYIAVLLILIGCNDPGSEIYTARVVSVRPDRWTSYCRYVIEPLNEKPLPRTKILAECRWTEGDTIVVKL